MLIVGHPDDVHRFLLALQGNYKRSRRELSGAAALSFLLFCGGLVLLRGAISSIGRETIGPIVFYFVLAFVALALPIWLFYTLRQQQYTFQPDQIAAWRGRQKLWSINTADIDRIMYSSGANGVAELAFYPQKSKARTLACTDGLNNRVQSVLAQWRESQTQA